VKGYQFIVRGKPLGFKFLFCSDGKFLNCVMGMTGATGLFCCPFCFVPNSMWPNIYAGKICADDYLRQSFALLSRPVSNCPQHPARCRGDSHGCVKPNLLEGIFELEDIYLDELHLFLRLWDLLLNILLGYVEPFHREDILESVARELGVCFHMLDGVDSKNYQLWTPLTGDVSKKLLDGLVRNKDLMRRIFVLGEDAKDLPVEGEGTKEAHEMLFEAIYSIFSRLKRIIDYLRDDRKSLKTIEEFEKEVGLFIEELYEGWGAAVKKGWYLHMLLCHVPAQLRRLGGSIYICSCSEQERMNGKHTKLMLNCIQKQNSSKQLFEKQTTEIYFELHPEQQKKRNKHKPSKNKPANKQKGKRFTTETMDQRNKVVKPHKERKKRKTQTLNLK
jgi:hypothetical protein